MVCNTPPYGHAPTYQISLTYLERKKLWSGQASLRSRRKKISLKQYITKPGLDDINIFRCLVAAYFSNDRPNDSNVQFMCLWCPKTYRSTLRPLEVGNIKVQMMQETEHTVYVYRMIRLLNKAVRTLFNGLDIRNSNYHLLSNKMFSFLCSDLLTIVCLSFCSISFGYCLSLYLRLSIIPLLYLYMLIHSLCI
jgi:hypothetical protein